MEAITWLHPNQPPPTFQCGSQPIDGIFIAPQLLAQGAGGYLGFGDVVPSDHCAIWVDLHLPELCPHHQEGYVKPCMHRLQCKDLRVVEHYNQILLDILNPYNILQWVNQLNNQLQKPLDMRQSIWKELLNAINHVLTEAKQGAKNKCQKFKSGQVQWCPQVTVAINKILFWKSILKCELGGKVGLSIPRSCAHKARIDLVPYPGEYPIETLQEFVSKAYKQCCQLKIDTTNETCGLHYLISAQATA